MKVIGLSGAQGGGKSSLLKELMARGWHVDQFRVSRAVQKQLGWDSLARVMENPNTMIVFQNEIFEQKYKNDFAFRVNTHAMTLTERTFADILAYTTLWTWKFVDEGKFTVDEAFQFLVPFTRRCAEAQQEIYSGTMLLPLMDHIQWEDDTNRASKADACRVYEDIGRFLDLKMQVSYPRLVISGRTVTERADQVEVFLRSVL